MGGRSYEAKEEGDPVDPETGKPFKLIPLNQLVGDMSPAEYDIENSYALPDKEDIDLRNYATPVKNQGTEGLCTSFGTAASMELAAKVKTGREFDLSERHLWSLYKILNMTPAIKAASKTHITGEEAWPYRNHNKPQNELKGLIKITETSGTLSVSGAIEALRKRQALVWGGPAPRTDKKGVATGGVGGGHSMSVVGAQFDDRAGGGGYFIIKNSWGGSYGDKGYVYIPFDYCKRNLCFFNAVADVEILGEDGKPLSPIDEKDSRIKAAIGAVSAAGSDSYTLWIAAPKDVKHVAFCTSVQAANCKPGINGYTMASMQRTTGDQLIFKSDSSVTLSPNLQIAVVAFGDNDEQMASRNLMFVQTR